MNKEQEIERMAKVLSCEKCHVLSWDCPKDQELPCVVNEEAKEQATALSEAGIGDKKQAVKEFRDKFWNNICIELNDVLGKTPSLRIEVKQYIEYVLNNIFTELYGVEE